MAEQSLEGRFRAINSQTLTPLVCKALNESVEVTEWQFETIHGGIGVVTAGLYRFHGLGQVKAQARGWSLILKVIQVDSELDSDVTSTWVYWKREALAYESGLLEDLPGPLAAPRCFAVQEIDDGEIWIWLEEIPAETDDEWPLAKYGVAAKHLGQFNGAYLGSKSLPSHSWFSNGRIHEWLTLAEDVVPRLQDYMAHPFARSWFPDDAPERMDRLWSRKEELLDGLADLPRTLCHHDAFRRNLMSGQDERGHVITYALDWSMLGPGVIGEEIATMFSVSLQFLDFDSRSARQFDTIIYEGYLAGLRSARWNGQALLVRFGFAASAALFMGLGGAGHSLKMIVDENRQEELGQLLKQPPDRIADLWSYMQLYLLGLGDEALALLEII